MSADRELIERAKSLAHTFDGEFATAPHTRRVSEVHLPAADMDRLLALASAGADMDGALPIGVSEVAEALRAARLAGVRDGLDAAALAVAADHGSSYRGVEHAINRIRSLDAAAVAARGRG